MLKLKNLHLTFFLCFFLFSLYGEEKASTPIPLPPKLEGPNRAFHPQMLDHDFPGCPANSICAREQGQKRLTWVQLLQRLEKESGQYAIREIESFRQKTGIPIGLWVYQEGLNNPEIISWNSGCPHHNREIKQVYQGEMLLKQIEFEDNEKVHSHKVWLENHEKKLVAYKIPRGSSPIQIIDNKLYFNANELGIYYGLLVGEKGSLEVVDIKAQPFLPHETACSKPLRELKELLLKDKSIFQDYYCRAIWDQTRKTYQVMLLGWSC